MTSFFLCVCVCARVRVGFWNYFFWSLSWQELKRPISFIWRWEVISLPLETWHGEERREHPVLKRHLHSMPDCLPCHALSSRRCDVRSSGVSRGKFIWPGCRLGHFTSQRSPPVAGLCTSLGFQNSLGENSPPERRLSRFVSSPSLIKEKCSKCLDRQNQADFFLGRKERSLSFVHFCGIGIQSLGFRPCWQTGGRTEMSEYFWQPIKINK